MTLHCIIVKPYLSNVVSVTEWFEKWKTQKAQKVKDEIIFPFLMYMLIALHAVLKAHLPKKNHELKECVFFFLQGSLHHSLF